MDRIYVICVFILTFWSITSDGGRSVDWTASRTKRQTITDEERLTALEEQMSILLGNLSSGSLRGPKGDLGQPGVPGPSGIDGRPGMPGRPGEKGEQGIPGEPGQRGLPGLKGNKGSAGRDGSPGERGQKGSIGFPGDRGSSGLKGNKGSEGLPGIPGMNGKDMTKYSPIISYVMTRIQQLEVQMNDYDKKFKIQESQLKGFPKKIEQ